MDEALEKLEADPGDVDLSSVTLTDKRILLGAIKGGISGIPFVGSILVGALEGYQTGRLQDFIEELSN